MQKKIKVGFLQTRSLSHIVPISAIKPPSLTINTRRFQPQLTMGQLYQLKSYSWFSLSWRPSLCPAFHQDPSPASYDPATKVNTHSSPYSDFGWLVLNVSLSINGNQIGETRETYTDLSPQRLSYQKAETSGYTKMNTMHSKPKWGAKT